MSDKEYFSHLYEIASNLNREFSLNAALSISLEKTVELLNLETGWIWLVQADVKSVYLATSYNLPPALSNHPERLSGWCFCIEKYLSDDISKARNISEIACSRLKNIKSGTRDLKFHATIPIITNGQKVGLINLVSKETQQLNDQQLTLLNTISELIGIAIQRTRVQEAYNIKPSRRESAFDEVIERVLQSRIDGLVTNLHQQLACPAPTEERNLERDEVRLLITTKIGQIKHSTFNHFPSFLQRGDVLVLNTTATIAAALPIKLPGQRQGKLYLSTKLGDKKWLIEIRGITGNKTIRWNEGEEGLVLQLPSNAEVTLKHRFYKNKQWLNLWVADFNVHQLMTEYLVANARPIQYDKLDRLYPLSYY